MNRFRYQAMAKQFPFLDKTLMVSIQGKERNLNSCDGLDVARATRELLQTTPYQDTVVGSMVDVDRWSRVDFVLSDGSVVIDAVVREYDYYSNYAYEDPSHTAGETILEAIDRFQVAETLEFIVVSQGGYVIVDHYSQPNYRGTIYKPSRDFTWQQVIEEARAAAKMKVEAESNF